MPAPGSPIFDFNIPHNPNAQGQRPSQLFQNLGVQLGTGLSQFAPKAIPQGLGSLFDILSNKGQTDPQQFNRLLAQASRGNQAASQNVQGNLARAGLTGSGLGQALGASIGAAGASNIAGLRAGELSQAEERRRNDLNLLMSMLFDPAMGFAGLGVQGEQARAQRKDQKNSANIAALSSLIGGLVPV